MSTIVALLLTAAASNLNDTDESLTATTTTTAATDVTVNYVEFTTSSGANIGSGEQVTRTALDAARLGDVRADGRRDFSDAQLVVAIRAELARRAK